MERRSYGQYCPLALALDTIGERWTLLVVRELMFGPRRFTDLLRSLPGIGTNLLSKRLHDLEEGGIVAKRELPPPAASAVYELDARGLALLPAVQALAEWGMASLPRDLEGRYLGVAPTMGYMKMAFLAQGDSAAAKRLTCELRAGAEVFHAKVVDHRLQLAVGELPDARIVCEADLRSILGMLGRPATVTAALRDGSLSLRRGEKEELRNFVKLFAPFPA